MPHRTSLVELAAASLVATAILGDAVGQDGGGGDFAIEALVFSDEGFPVVAFEPDSDYYYTLVGGADLGDLSEALDMTLADEGVGLLVDLSRSIAAPDPGRAFYRIARRFRETPGDADGDGIDDVFELLHGTFLDPLDRGDGLSDFDRDGVTNADEYREGTDLTQARLTTVHHTSPADGEDDVAVTRETFVKLSWPLADGSAVTTDHLFAEFGGQRLAGRVQLSANRDTITLFYDEILPPSAVVRVAFDPAGLVDATGRPLDADGDGTAGGAHRFSFETLTLTRFPGTAVCGRIFASELGVGDNGEPVSVPLEGVTITVDGLEDEVFAVTDQFGDFRLDDVPVGDFFVHINGKTAVGDIPPGAYYPNVGKTWTSVIGEETNVEFIYLPLIYDGTLKEVSTTEVTEIGFAENFLAGAPDMFRDVKLTVPPDALYSDDGTRGGMVGIAPVDPDRVPGTLPPWLQFPIVITVQTDGATNFDQPVPVSMPNLPNPVTRKVLPPGAKTALWSFNHDTGQFEIVGSMTISEDGTLAVSDPGVGILAPGWHAPSPGTQGGGGPANGNGNQKNPNPKGGSGSEKPPNGNQNKCEPPGGSGNNGVGDPVYPFSGEFYETVTDLRIKGVGRDFIWERKYRSRLFREGGRRGTAPNFGHGWDHSFNLRLFREGTTLLLCSGNGRLDPFLPKPGTSGAGVVYQRAGLYQTITVDAETGGWCVTFADGGKWLFTPFGGSGLPAAEARIHRIVDRNGNTLTVRYDDQGRLSRIVDTLDRAIRFSYNTDNLMSAVTDFAGRSVRYAYYRPSEAGGNPGDLKSVTTPAVTGTPHGNDFPNGKTITYTYTKIDTAIRNPTAREELAHNLLTITDGRRNDPGDSTFGAGPYVVNHYAAVTDPDDFQFDRVTHQFWGGGRIDFRYHRIVVPALAPTVFDPNREPPQPSVFTWTVVNDRMGNVDEYLFNASNQLIRHTERTGRADPTRPSGNATTSLSLLTTEEIALDLNPPTGRLRASDPSGFATRYTYGGNSLASTVVHPNGNLVIREYGDTDPRARGNMTGEVCLPGAALAGLSDQPEIATAYEYNTTRGACCGLEFVTRGIDGRGNEWRNEYDDRGNLVKRIHRISSITEEFEYNARGQVTRHVHPDNGSGHRQVDAYLYHEDGPQRGYLRAKIVDAENLALVTQYEYDSVGNVVRVTDPRGNDTEMVVNERDQVVRIISKEVRPGTGLRYQRDLHYDANDNLVRRDVQNVDENGAVQANAHLTTTYEYEILDHLVRQTEEVAEDHHVVTEYGYDANRNVVLERMGEATSGDQPDNVVVRAYDERDLLFRETRGAGGADPSTTQFDYDGNKNLIRTIQGLEGDNPRVTTMAYDGYDRLVRTTDAMGNVRTLAYDANGNVVEERVDGESIDVSGAAGNELLSRISKQYDAMNRLVRRDEAHFVAETGDAIGDGEATTTYAYSDFSKVIAVTNDNGHTTNFAYDTANRLATTTDAKGNEKRYTYDGNDNVTRLTEVDKSDLGNPAQTFYQDFEYDGLDRLAARTDNVGNRHDWFYDSRDNKTLYIDALRPEPDDPGNVVRYVYDGLNRLLETRYQMTDDGTGAGNVVGEIVTKQEWDDSSRLVAQIDDNGNATRYVYDGLGRKTATVYADGTVWTYTFDHHDNVVRLVDANENDIRSTYDALDRKIRTDVTVGPGVSDDTTFEVFKFDGLSRLRHAEDDDSLVLRSYDSMANVMAETLHGEVTASLFDGVGNTIECVYPSGRAITTTYDELERKKRISDEDGFIAEYSYVGPGRVERRTHGNGTQADYVYGGIAGVANAAGDYSFKKMVRALHTRSADGAVLEDLRFGWDPMGNKTAWDDATDKRPDRVLAYDSIYRMVESVRDLGGGTSRQVEYEFDGVGNRLSVTTDGVREGYTLDATLPEPGDAAVNQYTSTPFGAQSHDSNGSLIGRSGAADGDVAIARGYSNLIAGHASEGGNVDYVYDALGRRISKIFVSDVALEVETLYFYQDWHPCEERGSSERSVVTNVFGGIIDECIAWRRGGEDAYIHADDQLTVLSTSGGDATIEERYDYSDYGIRTVLPEGAPLEETVNRIEFGFTGRRLDSETALYYYRTRYYEASVGRFLCQDRIGAWFDSVNVGNGRSYVGNNPQSRVDPYGMWSIFGQSKRKRDVPEPPSWIDDVIDWGYCHIKGNCEEGKSWDDNYEEDVEEFKKPLEDENDGGGGSSGWGDSVDDGSGLGLMCPRMPAGGAATS